MKKILVIGSFMTDLVVKSERFAEEGETIIGESFGQFTGGKGANQAVAAARLGGNVEMIGELGKDSFGKDQIQSLDDNNIKHDHVLFTSEASSGIGNPQLDASGHNRIVVVPGANFKFMPSDLDKLEDVIRTTDIIILQLEIPLETVYEAIKLGNKYDKEIILNPAPAAKLDPKIAPMVTYMTPNEHEAQLITGIKTDTDAGIKKAANELLRQGYKNVLMTLGDKGSYFKNAEAEFTIPAFKVSALDTTAAGDSYIGAFAYGLSNGDSVEDSLHYAAATAAIAVTKMGAQPSLPTKKEVDDFLEKNKLIKN